MSDQTNSSLSHHSLSMTTDIKLYARLIWRWSWLIVLCALVAGATAFLVSSNMTPIYQATSRLMINQGNSPGTSSSYSDILVSERVASTYSKLMTSGSTLTEALSRLGIDMPAEDLAAQITGVNVTPIRDTQLVDLTVKGISPELAAAVANALPQVFVEELREVQSGRFSESKASLQAQLDELSQQVELAELKMSNLEDAKTAQDQLEYGRLRNALTQYQGSYANLLQTYEMLRLTEAQSLDTIVVMEPAKTPISPVSPRTMNNVLLATIVGGMLALGLVFLVEYLDDRIRTPEDLKRVTTLPVLGMISQLSGKGTSGEALSADLISATEPRNPTVEAYRRLRTNLQFYNVDQGLHSLVVTSANPSEGKSMTAVNLAIVLAQSGQKVVLVDADMRKPRLHKIFGIMRKPGLSEVLASGLPPESSLISVGPTLAPGVPNLRVLVAGGKAPNPAELLGSQRMQAVVDYLKQESDVVIFDAPPLLAVADAQVTGRMVDGTLLIVNTQKTSGTDLQRAIEMLEQVNVPLWGVVLNRLSRSGRGYYYYSYDYYYADSDSDDPGESEVAPKPGSPLRPSTRPAHSAAESA